MTLFRENVKNSLKPKALPATRARAVGCPVVWRKMPSSLAGRRILPRSSQLLKSDYSFGSHFWQPCYSPWLSMALYGVIGYLRDARTTFRGWSDYKRRTGKWPWVSIGVHSLNSMIVVLGTCALIWHAVEHHWARGKFIAILVLLAVFHMVLWTWVSNKAKLAQIRSERRLARTISKSHFH